MRLQFHCFAFALSIYLYLPELESPLLSVGCLWFLWALIKAAVKDTNERVSEQQEIALTCG